MPLEGDVILEKSAPEKSTGRFMSEKLGEKPCRLGLKFWLFRSPLNPGVKMLWGVGALFDCGGCGAVRFCGICGVFCAVSSSSILLLLRFRREWDSLSPLSRTTRAMRSNSAHTPSMRLTPPCSSVTASKERKITTWFINLTSERARAS